MRHRSRRPGLVVPVVATGLLSAALGVALVVMNMQGPVPLPSITVANSGISSSATLPDGSSAASPTQMPPTASATPGTTRPSSPTTTPTVPKPTSSSAVASAGERVITFVNTTSQTIWPAAQADPKAPLAQTGWVVPPGGSVSILMPDNWNGRLWGRTGCVFNSSGDGHCVTGDCDGHFQCGTAGSASPETLAELDLDAWDGMDFYDVNLDGFNLPMWINHTGGTTPDKVSSTGCVPAGCTHNLLATCPSVLQDKANGVEVGCFTACNVFGTAQYCCAGSWSSRAACQPTKWPVDYAAIFKAAEPTGYSYVYDDATSVFTCSGSCNYRITFGVSP
jgi:Thaumatin family